MYVQFDLMLASCCNDHREIPDDWDGKASPPIRFTIHLIEILRNFVPLSSLLCNWAQSSSSYRQAVVQLHNFTELLSLEDKAIDSM